MLLVAFSFIVLIVPFARARVYMCGRVVGWLVGWLWREGDACLVASAWGERGAWVGGGWVGVCAVSANASAGVTSRFRVGLGCGGCGLLGGVVLLLVR